MPSKNRTTITAEPGRQELCITREFDAPPELVFKAHTDPELFVRWLGPRGLTTTLETFEPVSGGKWRFIQKDQEGNEYAFHGVFHEVSPERLMQRFESEGLPESGHVTLETLMLESLANGRTRLTAQSVFQSVSDRDGMIQSGMERGVREGYERLDGFIAGPNDGPKNGLGDGGERLFKWYSSGDTDFPMLGSDVVFKISRASAALLKETWPLIGASVTGRKTFDIASGWGGSPPGGADAKYFVVTHTVPQEWVREGSPFTFVTDGVESAVEKAKRAAGDKNVDLMGASIVQQCLKAGLVDEIQFDLAPVLLDGGVHLFDYLGTGPTF